MNYCFLIKQKINILFMHFFVCIEYSFSPALYTIRHCYVRAHAFCSQVESGSTYMKGDPTLASSLGSTRGVASLHYEQPGSPGSQMTLYGSGTSAYPYAKATPSAEYWSTAGTPSPPTFDCVQGYQTAISVGDTNILYSGGVYSVSTGNTTSSWSNNLSLSSTEENLDGMIMTVDPKECSNCAILTTVLRRDEAGNYLCQSCAYTTNKMNGINRASIKCGKPKQAVATVNFIFYIFLEYVLPFFFLSEFFNLSFFILSFLTSYFFSSLFLSRSLSFLVISSSALSSYFLASVVREK